MVIITEKATDALNIPLLKLIYQWMVAGGKYLQMIFSTVHELGSL